MRNNMARARRVLVVTNGEVTEKQYCDLLNKTEDAKPRGQRGFHITCQSNPVDPAQLARYAVTLVDKDRKASEKKNGGSSDPYDFVFVVIDVDDYLRDNPGNLREAQATCNNNGMRLVISDPCFEVWLIDHAMVCPSNVTTQREAESLAKLKGLTTGRGNKYLVPEKLCGFVGTAVINAGKHNDHDVAARRKSLQGASFAPWTDFHELVKSVGTV